MDIFEVGVNTPFTDRPWPERTWSLLARCQPRELRIVSFMDAGDLERLLATYPTARYHVRPKLGDNHQGGREIGVLDFTCWEGMRTLRNCLDALISHGVRPILELDNEPDIEIAREPVGDWPNIREATRSYSDWFHQERHAIAQAYGDQVIVAAAALSQGSQQRFDTWRARMTDDGCYENASVLIEHLYSDGRPLDDPEWLGRWAIWPEGMPLDVTECNDNGALFTASPEERAAHFGEMLRSLRDSNRVRSVSVFTLPGSPDDSSKPAWWFLTEEVADVISALNAESQQPAAPNNTVNPWQWWTSNQIAEIAGVEIAGVWEHWPMVARALGARGIWEREIAAGVIGTMAIETASTMRPVEEAYWLKGPNGEETAAWREEVKRYYPHHGRGDVQITWEDGYRQAGQAIGVDLLANPGLALAPVYAAAIIAWWFDVKGVPSKDGTRFYRLVDLCRERDWYWTRVAVQGGTAHLDRLIAVANGLLVVGETPVAITPPAPIDIVTDRALRDVPDDLVRQRNGWTCAVRSTYAALWEMAEMGLAPKVTYGDRGERDVHEWMVPEIDSEDVGLHYGDGHQLEALLASKGYTVGRKVGASLADVQAKAGIVPVLLGFTGWGEAGHWVYCRGVDAEGLLILENPAGTYDGISDRLRDSFGRLGRCTMVWVELVPVAGAEEPADVAALKARLAQLEGSNFELGRQVADKDRRLMSVVEGFAVAADDLAPKIVTMGRKADRQRAVAEIQQLRRDRTA